MTDRSGFLLVAKPVGITSRETVDQVQKVWTEDRLGHCGTLDPAASGLLVIAVGRARRLVQFVHELPKTYRATFRFGVCSQTHDTEAALEPGGPTEGLTADRIAQALKQFVGEINQTPPRFSAVKVEGRRAHEVARLGQEPALRPRKVHVYEFRLLRFEAPLADFEIICGGGTYIRSLARDLGEALGCGAVLTALTRTATGPFKLTAAYRLDALPGPEHWRTVLKPMRLAVMHLPWVVLTPQQVQVIIHGGYLKWPTAPDMPDTPLPTRPLAPKERVALVNEERELVAIGEYDPQGPWIKPAVVLTSPKEASL
jgi:tRNA pseudouridine55 synthase